MVSSWLSCVILFAALFGTRALPLEDDQLVEKVKTIVSHFNDYIATHGLNELLLPNIGIFSFDPVKLRNGRFGEFSSIYVQEASSVNKTEQGDDTFYSFDIKLGLKELKVHYDFDISSILIKEKGNFSLSLLKNSAQLTGSISFMSNELCRAKLKSVRVLELEDTRIELPDDVSAVILVSELILNTITPILIPLFNTALRSALLVPGAQNVFSAIACSLFLESEKMLY